MPVQVMELMTGGELYDRVVAKGKFTEAETRNVVVKVARALEYCHARGIVHRDLKVRWPRVHH
jgi:calcium/calmodulin-dependent protein kinase I